MTLRLLKAYFNSERAKKHGESKKQVLKRRHPKGKMEFQGCHHEEKKEKMRKQTEIKRLISKMEFFHKP